MNPDCKNPEAVCPPEGRYANYFQVGYNAFEFLLDFGQHYLEGRPTHFHTRIITGPAYVKWLSETLRKSIVEYEQTWGNVAVEDPQEGSGK